MLLRDKGCEQLEARVATWSEVQSHLEREKNESAYAVCQIDKIIGFAGAPVYAKCE